MHGKSIAPIILLIMALLLPVVSGQNDAGSGADAPDDRNDAKYITAGTYSANIDTGQEEDWYWYDSTEGLTVRIEFDNSLMDIDLAIYVNNEEVEEDISDSIDNDFEEVETERMGNITIQISELNDETGAYTLIISAGFEAKARSSSNSRFVPGFQTFFTITALLLACVFMTGRRNRYQNSSVTALASEFE